MVGYRRMGNMDHHLGNATSTNDLLQQLGDTLKSPRGTVFRIQALALVAITLTFLLAAFGSCRRWSNRWIVQKGFLAANVLSISLGTYSIGLMQSSVVKSELYPVWAVSLLALFGCIDPVTSFNGLEYKSPLSKMLFQLFLYFGYVLLMSISTISSNVGNLAICVLSAITFLKGFHRLMAHVLPRRMQDMLENLDDDAEKFAFADVRAHFEEEGTAQGYLWKYKDNMYRLIVEFPPVHELHPNLQCSENAVSMEDIKQCFEGNDELQPFKDVCFAFSLSHLLQKNLLGMRLKNAQTNKRGRVDWAADSRNIINYKWALTVIEIELAFLYEVFFTGNAFLHYHQATTASFWALASFMGICFVTVVVAIPGTMSNHHTTHDPFVVVHTTTADLIITLVILVSLALLQLVQLIRCWTSKWARVAVACEYTRKHKKWRKNEMERDIERNKREPAEKGEATRADEKMESSPTRWWSWWMRLKVFVVTRRSRSNWFDKYLWQKKLGQYSFIPEGSSRRWCKSLCCIKQNSEGPIFQINRDGSMDIKKSDGYDYKQCAELLGIQYIRQVLWDFLGSDINRGAGVKLDDDVKGCITNFLGETTGDKTGKDWSSFLVDNGADLENLPYTPVNRGHHIGSKKNRGHPKPDASHYASCIFTWHVATYYCERAEQEQEEHTGCSGTSAVAAAATSCTAAEEQEQKAEREKNRHVAIALSKYCAYLMVSAPELLPGPSVAIKYLCGEVAPIIARAMERDKDKFGSLKKYAEELEERGLSDLHESYFVVGVRLGCKLHGTGGSDPWKVLAKFWVQALTYAAPYGKVEAHMQHLSQGGELITHLWAMLYHIGIREWQPGEPKYWDEKDSCENGGHSEDEGAEDSTDNEADRPGMTDGGQTEDDGHVKGSCNRRPWSNDNFGASSGTGTWPQPIFNPRPASQVGPGAQHPRPPAQQQHVFAAGHVGGGSDVKPRRKRVHHVKGRLAPHPGMTDGGQTEDDGHDKGSCNERHWRNDNSGASSGASAGAWPQPILNPRLAGQAGPAGPGAQHPRLPAQQQLVFAAGHFGGGSKVVPRRKRVHLVKGRPASHPGMTDGGQTEDDGHVKGSCNRRPWSNENSGASSGAGTWLQPIFNPGQTGQAGPGTQHPRPPAQQQQVFAAGHVGGAAPRLSPPGFPPGFYSPPSGGVLAGHSGGAPPRMPAPRSARTDGGQINMEEMNLESGGQTKDDGATYYEFMGPVEDSTPSLQQPGLSSRPVHSINRHIPDLNELPLDKLSLHDHVLNKNWLKMNYMEMDSSEMQMNSSIHKCEQTEMSATDNRQKELCQHISIDIDGEEAKVGAGNSSAHLLDGTACENRDSISVEVVTGAGVGQTQYVAQIDYLEMEKKSRSNQQKKLHKMIIKRSQHNKPKKAHIDQIVPEDYICTKEDFEIINHMISSTKNKILVDINGAIVNRDLMDCLFHDNTILNGDVINAYIHCIRGEKHLLHRDGGKVFLEDTYITSILKRDGALQLEQISYNGDIIEARVDNYLDHDMIFLPINIKDSHWYLAIINAPKCEIHVLDSLGKMDDRSDLENTLRGLHRQIKLAGQHKELNQNRWHDLNVATWPVIEKFMQPMQRDGTTCGLWMVNYMEYWTGSQLSDTTTQDDIANFRLKLAAILWDSRLNKRRGFQEPDQINDDEESPSDVDIIDTPEDVPRP